MALKIIKASAPASLESLQEKARHAASQGDLQEAIRLLEQGLIPAPDDGSLLRELGTAHLQVGNLELARSFLLRSLGLQFDPEALSALGVVLFQRGHLDQAYRCLQEARNLGAVSAAHNLSQIPPPNDESKFPSDPEIEDLLRRITPRISACLIVKNEERFLGLCLESLQGVVDEIIVIDTGSTDRTASIAESLGAKVHHFPWRDDFSAARNESLRHATGEWVLIIDADERLEPATKGLIRRAVADPGANSYFLELENRFDEANSNTVSLPRLFRKQEGVYYTGYVHEQVLPQLEALGYRHLSAPIRIIHEGYREEILRSRGKDERNLELLEKQFQETPDDIYIQFQLGKQLAFGAKEPSADQLQRAVTMLESACAGLGKLAPPPLAGAEFYLILAKTYRTMHQDQQAATVCRRGLRLFQDYPDLRYYLALSLKDMGYLEEAVTQFQRCRTLKLVSYPCESDPSVRSWRSLMGEADCLGLLNRHAEALSLLEKANQASPSTHAVTQLLASTHAKLEQYHQALRHYRSIDRKDLRAVDWYQIAQCHFRLGELPETLQALRHLDGEPALMALGECLKGECLLWLGDPHQASVAYQSALRPQPASVAAVTGLVACGYILGRFQSPLGAQARIEPYLSRLGDALRSEAPLSGVPEDFLTSWALLFRHALAADQLALPEAMIQKGMASASTLPGFARRLASVLLSFEAAPLALELLDASLAASQDSAEHMFLLGHALEMVENPMLAREAYRACLELEPDDASAKAKLASMEGRGEV